MIEMLPSAEDVIALKASGHIDRDEMIEIAGRIEDALTVRDKTHMFVEVVALKGFDPKAVADVMPQAMAMLRRLDRFGRVAVVAEQDWVRWWAKLESALLPRISYETFTPDQRQQALDWVEGRRPLPHGPALTLIETDTPGVAGFEIDGKIGADEVAAAYRHFGALAEREPRLRLLGRVRRLEGVEPRALLDTGFLQAKLSLLKAVERYAIVGGPDWLRGWVSMTEVLARADIRHFPADEEKEAWAWLGARPTGERGFTA